MESRGSKPITNLTGQVFTRLTVRECVRDAKGRVAWRCDCSCGGSKVVKAACMFSGDTKSCGCLRREVMRAKATKHGACMPGQRTPEYWIHRKSARSPALRRILLTIRAMRPAVIQTAAPARFCALVLGSSVRPWQSAQSADADGQGRSVLERTKSNLVSVTFVTLTRFQTVL